MTTDLRRAPFCWQSLTAMKVLRAYYAGPQRSTAISVYQAFTEVANEQRDRASFEATRKHLADLAGVHVDTLDDYAQGLQEIGLIGREAHKKGGKNLPNTWTLKDPEGVAVPDRQGGGATPLGGGGARPQQELNKKNNNKENPIIPLENEDQAPVTAEEEVAARDASSQSPPSPGGVLDGNAEIGGSPDPKESHELSVNQILAKMRKDYRAYDSECTKFKLAAEGKSKPEYNQMFEEWKKDRTLPGRGAVASRPSQAERMAANRTKIRSFVDE